MHTTGKLLFLLGCLAFVGCHRCHHRHNACVDQHPCADQGEWEECDDDDDDDGCLWFGKKKHCHRCEPTCCPSHDYGFAPPIYGHPTSQCGCETGHPPMTSGNWPGQMPGMPTTSGCSTCGNSPTGMPTYPSFPTEPTFTPHSMSTPQTFSSPGAPTPAPASEYYSPQPTPVVPTPANPDSASLPHLGHPTAF